MNAFLTKYLNSAFRSFTCIIVVRHYILFLCYTCFSSIDYKYTQMTDVFRGNLRSGEPAFLVHYEIICVNMNANVASKLQIIFRLEIRVSSCE